MFSFQTLSKANDINDFEIDGIGLGDSALDYFSKSFIVNELESELTYFYKDQKFAIINTNIQSKQYDRISLTIKPNDEKYIIYSIKGSINFENKFQECLTLRDKITKAVHTLFEDLSVITNDGKHDFDKTGKSLYYSKEYDFSNGSEIRIYCMNWSKKITERYNYKDQLNVILNSKEMMKFLSLDPY